MKSEMYALSRQQIEAILRELEAIDFGQFRVTFWQEMWALVNSNEHPLEFELDDLDGSFEITIAQSITLRVLPRGKEMIRCMWSHRQHIYTKSPYLNQEAATKIYDRVLALVLDIAA